MERPLEGIKVLEWAIFHAGPGSSAILGDLGAEVIKIEQLGIGDPVRQRAQIGHTSFDLPGGSNLFCEGANRNKKSIAMDLSSEKGRALVYRMVPRFDVFVTNIRRRTVEQLGLAYQALRELNPSLIYLSVSCHGPEGPDKDAGGFDYNGQGRAGIMYGVGDPGGPPMALHFAMIDQATAVVGSQAILAALVMRQRTGKGQLIETSVLGAGLNLAYFNYMYGLWLGTDPGRHDRTDTDPARNYYRASDGRWMVICLVTEAQWESFCEAIGRPELAVDPRFATAEKRQQVNARELIRLLDEVLATRTRDEWLARLAERDMFVSPINRADELADDPQVRANYLGEIQHPRLGKLGMPAFPARFSGATVGTRTTAPDLGEHTEEVLRQWAGCGDAEIEELRDEGVV